MSIDRRQFIGRSVALAATALPSLAPSLLTSQVHAGEDRLIIDTHTEVWTLDPKFPFNHPEAGAKLKVDVAAPIENLVGQMHDFGIRYAVLINPRYFGWDNSYIAHSLSLYPDLFVAHGLLQPEDPKIADKLRYWITERGFQGMRFSPIYHPKSTWLNSRDHDELWRTAEKLGAVFNYYIAPHQMPMLEEMAGRFPGVKIVVDHAGKPDLNAKDCWPEFRKMFRLKKFPQVWISNSEPYEMSELKKYPYEDTLPFYKAIYEEFGGQQLIWGTGYPRPRWELPMDQELEFVDKFCDFYTAADRELMLGKNALRIWKFAKS
ncbi:amidohydrolase family protein [Schlesneria paludicola]|uniref:amidohydrolase family protein n=1 Tax=Schlesneria paludicola TaxID=360056 RepID=UPI000299D5D2|nr:amidohydrolase family protein [Schlesneria paludicola]